MERTIKLIVFDLDGTVIHSAINFKKMKTKMIEYLVSKGVDKDQLSIKYLNVVILSKSENIMREKGVSEE